MTLKAPVSPAQLRSLVMVASTGSVTIAARRLDYSPSTVSTHLSALERDLGVRLLRRADGKFVATRKGLQVVSIAARVLAELERLSTIERDDF